MIINIDSNWRISSDERQWTVQKYDGIDKETGKQRWSGVSYHSTAQHTVSELAHRRIRAGDAQTLVDALAHVQNVVATLTRALTPQIDVQVKGG